MLLALRRSIAFTLVGRDHARAGDDLALARGLQRRQLQVEEAVGRGAEERQREGGRARTRAKAEVLAGRLTNCESLKGSAEAAICLLPCPLR
jgi:hypothetical protein